MKIKTQDYNGVTVIEPQGELTEDFIETFRNTCSNVMAENKTDGEETASEGVQNRHPAKDNKLGIVLDMSKVGFIDSEGLEQILWLRDFCRENGYGLKLAGLDENCAKILEITRLEEKFDRYAELAQAVKSFA